MSPEPLIALYCTSSVCFCILKLNFSIACRVARIRVSNPEKGNIFLFCKYPDWLLVLHGFLVSGYRCSFAGAKRPWPEHDHSHLSSARLKMTGAIPPRLLHIFTACAGISLPFTLHQSTGHNFLL